MSKAIFKKRLVNIIIIVACLAVLSYVFYGFKEGADSNITLNIRKNGSYYIDKNSEKNVSAKKVKEIQKNVDNFNKKNAGHAQGKVSQKSLYGYWEKLQQNVLNIMNPGGKNTIVQKRT